MILPLLDDGRVLLERQFRYPNDRVFIEFPAGKIDPGEDHLACAKRELEEETGYTADRLAFRLHHPQRDRLFGRAPRAVPGARPDRRRRPSSTRASSSKRFTATVPELLEMVRRGEITDVKTIIGTFWLEKILAGSWAAGRGAHLNLPAALLSKVRAGEVQSLIRSAKRTNAT